MAADVPDVPECRESFWPNGRLRHRCFYVNGELHNTNGPALEQWHASGRIHYRSFAVNNMLHRTDGPAWEEWNDEGRFFPTFWVNGKPLSEEDFIAWQERQQRQRELRALAFALEHKFPADAPEREFLRRILPAHMAGGSGHVN